MRFGQTMYKARNTHIKDESPLKEYLRSIKNLLSEIILINTLLISFSTLANPVVDNVAAGDVTIQQTPGSTVVNQTSDKAIINWQSFNIGASESTHFQQPAGGVALNRINPTQGASEIYGRLTATGQIILVNPAGIYFGPSAYVNVGGLIASTSNISDQDFLNSYYHFTTSVSPYSGAVVNEGQIIAAENGLVALIGSSVSNSGYIEANVGQIALGSGSAFTIHFANNEMISFSVESAAVSAGIDKNGNSLTHGVSNTGTLKANGGKILVTAKAAVGILDNAINMKGMAEAKSVGMKNGELVLMGNEGT